ncbi:PREDICTED: pleckstrin homology domain-containing family G member 6 [Dipodomys ordii]|uniref:Pleckstrin homology domain-containing family G member 6 n=1 Tax=Dipodomys ordii TaxID=10020 RepID=A0A1S3FSP5_DIPOR|nr:PREDICTED: pleckstrin homology domain-containing family G member 6 [Dipodomys ordii]
MQTWASPEEEGPLRGLVASRIEAYGGRHRASGPRPPRGGGSEPDLSGRGQYHGAFAKAQAMFREPEPERRHGGYLKAGPPHSPKLKEIMKAQELEAKLHIFSMFGMPRLPPEDRRLWEIGEGGDSGLAIEKSWRELVPGHEEMSQERRHQQEALWELLTTEVIYVRRLKIMTDLLAAGLLNLQRVGLLMEVSAETLFGNVPSLIRAHRSFWEEVLEPSLEETRTSGQPLDPLSLQNGFLMFSQRFHPYIRYCLQVKHAMAYARAQQDTNLLFHTFVKWCEKHKRSGRQMLEDLLIKPHQRITKYPLLLHAVLKRSPEPRVRDALTAMIGVVESFLRHINRQVRQREEQEGLVAAAQRIGRYEVLEPASEEVEKNLRPFSTLDLMSPMLGVGPQHIRELLLEGPVRIKEGREGKLDVYLFLFSDLLLVTKPQRKTHKAKVIRPPLVLDKLVCRPLRDPNSLLLIHLSDLQCVASALLVQCPSPAHRSRWLEKTQKAQDALQRLKAEEYVQQKRELLALYRDQARPRPASPGGSRGSRGSADGGTPEPEDGDAEEEEDGDPGYGTLGRCKEPRTPPAPHFQTLPQPPGRAAPFLGVALCTIDALNPDKGVRAERELGS